MRWLESGGGQARAERIAAVHHDLETMAPAIQRTFDWLIRADTRVAPTRGRASSGLMARRPRPAGFALACVSFGLILGPRGIPTRFFTRSPTELPHDD